MVNLMCKNWANFRFTTRQKTKMNFIQALIDDVFFSGWVCIEMGQTKLLAHIEVSCNDREWQWYQLIKVDEVDFVPFILHDLFCDDFSSISHHDISKPIKNHYENQFSIHFRCAPFHTQTHHWHTLAMLHKLIIIANILHWTQNKFRTCHTLIVKFMAIAKQFMHVHPQMYREIQFIATFNCVAIFKCKNVGVSISRV